uniref:Uncharacterized protein n=1 Tax=Arundo donax TaxID=35708 RepID=A0A0A9EIC6_ARUDO
MDCQNAAAAGAGAAEDRSEVTDLREQILQLAEHACHEEEEKSRTELLGKLNTCKRDTLIELCRSFDIVASRANRKEELVSFLMKKFVKGHPSGIEVTNPDKVTDLREQILQLAGHACHEEEETSRTELLEKLNLCKRDTLIELCRSFDIIGSRANRKEELVSILMKFVKDHSSGIDGTNLDKKIKKRRRVKEEENLSTGKPLKKKKREGTALETQGEEEANGRKGVEDRTNYSARDVKDKCADNKKGKFPNEEDNLEPCKKENSSMSENVDAVALNEAPIRANEQVLTASPSAKVVTTAEVDGTNVKASKKKKTIYYQ